MKSKAQYTFEKIALDTRLMKLKPLLQEIRDMGGQLKRPKGKLLPQYQNSMDPLHYNLPGDGPIDPTTFKLVDFDINIPKTQNKSYRKLTKRKVDHIGSTIAHEIGHAKKFKELDGIALKDLASKNRHGKMESAIIKAKQQMSGGLVESIAKKPERINFNPSAREREAWQEAAKLDKRLNLGLNANNTANKSANHALGTYYKNEAAKKVLRDKPIKNLESLKDLGSIIKNRFDRGKDVVKALTKTKNKETFFK